MSLLLPVFLVLIAMGIAAKTGRRAEQCMPLGAFFAILLLYLCGLCGCLAAGVYLVIFVALVCAAYVLFIFFKKDRAVLKNAITPGLLAFLLASCALFVLVRRQVLSEWDEFSHWGLAVKDLFLTNAFAGRAGSSVVFGAYPPALTLLPYLAMKLSGAYAENTIYFTYGVFAFALLLPVLQKTGWKRAVSALLLSLCAFCLPLSLFPRFYISAYADGTLGLLTGYLLLAYFSDEKRDAFSCAAIFSGAAVLMLAKPTGIVFLLLAFFAIGFDLFRRARAGERADKKARRCCLVSAAACALLALSWVAYVRITGAGTDPVITAAISPGGTVQLAIPDYLRDVVFSFLIRFVRPAGTGAVPMSPLMWLCAFFALAAIGAKLQPDAAKRARALRYGVSITVGFAVYACLLLLAYLFAFSEYDALLLSSFDRYIGTYALGALVFFFGLFAGKTDENARPAAALLLSCALFAVLPLEETVTIMSRPGERIEMRASYAEAETAIAALDPASDKVCIVSQGQDALDSFILRYNAAPVPVTFAYSWTLGESKSAYDQWSVPVAPEKWIEEAVRQGCTHVYLYRIEETFLAEYASVFTGEIAENALYRIETTAAGKTVLTPNP